MKPHYCAVIFTTGYGEDLEGYAPTAAHMEDLARRQPGFLGVESGPAFGSLAP